MGNKSTINFQGNRIELDVPFLTPEEIRKVMATKVGQNRSIAISQAKGSALRPIDQIPHGTNLGTEVTSKSYPKGTVKGSMSRRERFIKSQVASVAEVYGERYGQAVQLAQNMDFVFIPCFTLPRRWGMRTTPILIWLPPQYPDIPPNGFYLSQRCRGPHILSRNVYGTSPDLSAKGWNWYCVHCDKGWSPKEDPNQEDNLWTFLDVVRLSLSINEF